MTRLLALTTLVLLASPARADSVELTLEEFKMYRHYLNAMEDSRVQAMKPEKRLGAIAKDAKFKVKDLEAAIAKGEAAGDVKAKCETQIKDALAKTELAGRMGKLEVDASDPHAVAYVEWLNENTAQLEEEAAAAASQVAATCPIVSTIQVWAQDKASPKTRVFQALISQSAASKINAGRIKDFADTRYIRLFEKVKSVAAGDDLSPEALSGQGADAGTAAPKP